MSRPRRGPGCVAVRGIPGRRSTMSACSQNLVAATFVPKSSILEGPLLPVVGPGRLAMDDEQLIDPAGQGVAGAQEGAVAGVVGEPAPLGFAADQRDELLAHGLDVGRLAPIEPVLDVQRLAEDLVNDPSEGLVHGTGDSPPGRRGRSVGRHGAAVRLRAIVPARRPRHDGPAPARSTLRGGRPAARRCSPRTRTYSVNRKVMSELNRRVTSRSPSILPTRMSSLNRIASVRELSTDCHSFCWSSRLIWK